MNESERKKKERIEAFLHGGMVTQEIFQSLEQARFVDAEWVWMFETFDPLIADQQIVRQMHEAAPTEYLKGVMGGILMLRESIALVTGRGF